MENLTSSQTDFNMASKKKQMTFADRAKKIMKRYEARPDDKAAQESKNRELAALKEEQEMFKRNKAMEAMDTINSMGYGNMLANGGPIDKSPWTPNPNYDALSPQEKKMVDLYNFYQRGENNPLLTTEYIDWDNVDKFQRGQKFVNEYADKIGNTSQGKRLAKAVADLNVPDKAMIRKAAGGTLDTDPPYSIYDNSQASTDSLNTMAKLEYFGKMNNSMFGLMTDKDKNQIKDAAEYWNAMSPELKNYYMQNVNRIPTDSFGRTTTIKNAEHFLPKPDENSDMFNRYFRDQFSPSDMKSPNSAKVRRKYATGGPFQTEAEERKFQDWANASGYDTKGYGWGPASQDIYDKYYTRYQMENDPGFNPGYGKAEQMTTPTVQGQLGMPAQAPSLISPYWDTTGQTAGMTQAMGVENATALGMPGRVANMADASRKLRMRGESGEPQGKPWQGEMNPYAGWAQAAGDIYGLAQSFRKTDPFTAQQLDHIKTDTTAQREAIDKAVGSASAGIREGGRQAGAANRMQAAVTGNAMLYDKAGQAKADIMSKAEAQDLMTNLGIDKYNQGQQLQADVWNRQQKDAKLMAQVAHMQNLGQTYAGYDKDKRSTDYQNALMKLIGSENYGFIMDDEGYLKKQHRG